MSNQEDKNCKGSSRMFTYTLLTYEKYKYCHENHYQFRLPLLSIDGFDHHSYTVLQNKVVFNNFDSKMYIYDYNILTFFYGSKYLNCVCENVIEICRTVIN